MASKERLFVGNIPFAICNHKDVRDLFEQIGGVYWVEVPWPDSKPGGFAFVTMESDADNSRAIERFNGYSLHGRSIAVELETPKTMEPSKKDKYTETEKWCAFCKRMLPHSDFAHNESQSHKLMGWCQECNAVHRAIHRAARVEGVEYAVVRNNRARVAELREDVRAGVRGAGGVRTTASVNAPLAWDKFIERAQNCIHSGRLEEKEIGYKREIAENLAQARLAVLSGAPDWTERVADGLELYNLNFVRWQIRDDFKSWCKQHPDDARDALIALWAEDGRSISERIDAFRVGLPQSVISGDERRGGSH